MPRRALLPLVLAEIAVGQMAGSECDTSVQASRRGPGSLAAAVSSSASVPQAAGGSHARYWQACTDALYVRDRATGGTALLQLALQQWQRAVPAIQGSDAGEPGCRLLAAAGELALRTGWMALDAERLTLARPLYEKARELAVRAADVMLAVHVLTSQSMLHAELAKAGPSREPARGHSGWPIRPPAKAGTFPCRRCAP